MLQLIGWRLRQMVRDVPMMFWGLAFPIIMGILFQVSFGNGSDEENMSVIPIALVFQENTNPFFEKFCEMLDGDTLTVQKVNEEEAQELLKQEEIAGIYYAGDPLRLKVSKAGMEQSILEMLLNVYEKNEMLIKSVLKEHPTKLVSAVKAMSDYQDWLAKDGESVSENYNYEIMYFYALIAFTCMSGAYLGVQASLDSKADLSPLGARRCISPVPKLRMILAELVSLVVLQFANVMIATGFFHWVLGLYIGTSLSGILLVNFMGSVIGVSIGTAIGSLLHAGEGIKFGITIGVTLTSAFLAGMMMGDTKDIIEHTCPIVNRLNPAAVLSDAYYCLGIYENPARLARCLAILGVMSVVLFTAAFLGIRRERYESI